MWEGSPHFGQIESPAEVRRVVDVAWGIYLVLFFTSAVLSLRSASWSLARYLGPRARWIVGIGGAFLALALLYAPGLPLYVAERIVLLRNPDLVYGTCVMTVALGRIRLAGPLLLLVGTVQAVLTYLWARRDLRQP
jgi:hypothetical protein